MHHLYAHHFPFTALVGQQRLRLSLILNAINPRIGGVLIRGQKGTAKSTAARGLAEVLPEIDVVAGCPYHCHPADLGSMCDGCATRFEAEEKMPATRRHVPFVTLPLGATEDRVTGAIDVTAALQSGRAQLKPGLLADANRGILYVDEVNLLDDHLVNLLLDAAAMGRNRVEREGLSVVHPARFVLVGTMNPEEGELRPQLLDRFGIAVDVEGIRELSDRVEILDRLTEYDRAPQAFSERFSDAQTELCDRIGAAISRLEQVEVDRAVLTAAARRALEAGVDGHRARLCVIACRHHRGNIACYRTPLARPLGVAAIEHGDLFMSQPAQHPPQARGVHGIAVVVGHDERIAIHAEGAQPRLERGRGRQRMSPG